MPKKKNSRKRNLTRREFIQSAAATTLTAAAAASCAHVDLVRRIASGPREEYEYIVIGSGAGGGPVAARLAMAGHRVCLIEAGTTQQGVNTTVPAFHLHSTEDPALAWNFYVQHYSNADRQKRDSKYVPGKGILYPRAGTLGGCTAHNALVTLYPENSDWDYLSGLLSDQSWNSSEMRGYFEKLENNHYIKPSRQNPTRNGFHGWLDTEQSPRSLLLQDRKLLGIATQAAISQGFSGGDVIDNAKLDPNRWDYVQDKKDGIFNIPKVTKDGVRSGTREFILATMQQYPKNLVLKTSCLATKILFGDESGADENRAVGIEYLEGEHLYRADPNSGTRSAGMSTRKQVFATREVILAGGAFNSPQLLMLSGIGDQDQVAKFGIKPRLHLPGVGKNLQDRYEISVVTKMTSPFDLVKACTYGAAGDPCLAQYLAGQSSVYSSNGIVLALLKRSSPDKPTPDLVVFGGPTNFRGYYPGYSKAGYSTDCFTWAVLKGHTGNTAGTVKLKSGDPLDTPDICFNYFEEGNDASGDDLESTLAGLKFAKNISNGTVTSFGVEQELTPGADVSSDEELRDWIRNESWGHHASCSNKMGPKEDPMAVVDGNFLVHGTSNLRIVDASVFPKIPGLFIVVPVYMIAEKAADVILGAAQS